VLNGALDVGVGHVRRTYRRPFGASNGSLGARSWFAKGEYLLYPWLITSVKYDRLRVHADTGVLPVGYRILSGDRDVVLPGLVMLVRQNIRVVVEGELLFGADERSVAETRRPHTLWLRLDLVF
jgi:hypothetical protein